MPSKRTHQQAFRAVSSILYGSPWAITPERLEAIRDAFELRRSGVRLTPEEIRTHIGATPPAPRAGLLEDLGYTAPRPQRIGSVAVLPIYGVVAQRASQLQQACGVVSTEQVSGWLRDALADSEVSSILLHVESPGGTVPGVEELSRQIFAARGQKRIVALADSMACSAAYWIASAASELVVAPGGQVGSIGVYLIHAEYSAALTRQGVKATIVSAGKHKTDGNSVEPLSDQAKATLQARVDEIYTAFSSAVARNRGGTPEGVRTTYGDGRTFLGQSAVDAGVADRVGTLDELLAELRGGKPAASPASSRSGRSARADVPVLPLLASSPLESRPVKWSAQFAAYLASLNIVAADAGEASIDAALAGVFRGQVPATEPAIVAALAALTARDAAPAPAPAASNPTPPAPVQTPAQIAAAAQVAERQRIADVYASAELLGLSGDVVASAVTGGLSVDQARASFVGELAKRNAPINRVEQGRSADAKFSAAVLSTLEYRGGVTTQLAAEARDLGNRDAVGVAALCLERAGIKTDWMNREQIARAALGQASGFEHGVPILAGGGYHTTGTFANLSLVAAHKSLQKAFMEAETTYRLWATRGESLPDFRAKALVSLSESGDLELQGEGQPPTEDKHSDAKEWLAIDKFAKSFSITWEMLLQDDLGAIARIPAQMGAAADRTLNRLIYAVLTANPTMADGYALFDATNHQGNLLSTGAAPSVSEIQRMRRALKRMKGRNSQAILNIPLKFLLVPTSIENEAEVAVGSTSSTTDNKNEGVINPIKKFGITVVADPNLDDVSETAYYGVAAANAGDNIVYSFLQGQETPTFTTEYDAMRGVRKVMVQQSFGASPAEYRTLVKNTGTGG